jgi:hypothetical protein
MSDTTPWLHSLRSLLWWQTPPHCQLTYLLHWRTLRPLSPNLLLRSRYYPHSFRW